MPSSLSGYLRANNLVSVHRDGIDDHVIQGFLLGASETLLALEHVYDFQVDGLMVLRRVDVTEIRRNDVDEFQEQLLKEEGIVAGTLGIAPLELDDWKSVIDQIGSGSALMILEQEAEAEPEFSIGRPLQTTEALVEFQSFSGTGIWYDDPEQLPISHITRLQAYSRYLSFYQRHFERVAS
jgi:hypothetical protein